MFGVVPKPLWEKRIPADERNRIPLAMRCLLVETPDALVLIDNGCGNKESAKFMDIYGIDNAPSRSDAGWPTRLEEAIAAAGFSVEDVDVMIDSHLHFDHAGGNTVLDEDAAESAEGSSQRSARPVRLAFPRARYVCQR